MSDSSAPMDLSSEKASAAFRIIQTLSKAGHTALFAGGCVRDHLLGLTPGDYDIATSALPDDVEELFPKTIPVGKQFGVILVLSGEFQFEVATFRTEGGYQDGRRPGYVKFSGAEEDARRRDFTINGLFYDPLKNAVLDYVEGVRDIPAKLVRCIGSPAERFEEDKLRLLRAVRFAAKFGFQIESSTWCEVCKRAAQIKTVSFERIRDEIDKILTSAYPGRGLELLHTGGFWTVLWPQLDYISVRQRFESLSAQPDILLALALLYKGQNVPAISEALKQFRYSNDIIAAVLRILEIGSLFDRFGSLRLGQIRLLAADPLIGVSLIFYAAFGSRHDSIRKKLGEFTGDLPPRLLNGGDLKSLGIVPGPQMGGILEEGYLLQLENQIRDKSEALAWAQSFVEKKH